MMFNPAIINFMLLLLLSKLVQVKTDHAQMLTLSLRKL